MPYNFDERIDRRKTDSAKWRMIDEDVLPMWVADMDFRSPQPIVDALKARVEEGMFGYGFDSKELREAICERMLRLYQWEIKPEDVVFIPGLVAGLNMASRAIGTSGDGVLMQTPVYGPFLSAPKNNARFANTVELPTTRNGQIITYEMDYDAFERAINPQTKLFLLCNPHNPIGRVYSREELQRLGEICLKHNLTICADEIHSDLLLDGNKHVPIASISPEIADKTITLMAASKTFNLPGIFSGYAIVQNADLRKAMIAAGEGVGHVNIFGFVSTLAAYRDGQEWLTELLAYLQGNRDYLTEYVQNCFPNMNLTRNQGTYLAWLDCNQMGIEGSVYDFFLKKARVALVDGKWFGRGGEGFVRLNFACPRSQLTEALDRMSDALKS